ncbi:MAG: aminoacyl-tRNA deacylase and HDOD domain-containing protein [Gammaproteobacteria bacterium]|nr:MAG: aminoacyl-tRNA deacylase and HDOD domain-containing protein [Gammaproteobacteria bacterium]
MTLMGSVETYLQRMGVSFRVHPYLGDFDISAIAGHHQIPMGNIARASLVRDTQGLIMVIYPAGSELDILMLRKQLQRDFSIIPDKELSRLFGDENGAALPPLCDMYGLPAIVDTLLDELDEVYFFVGDQNSLFQVRGGDFHELQSTAWHGSSFTRPLPMSHSETEQILTQGMPGHVMQCLEKVDKLPAMPEMAEKLLLLRSNKFAGAKELAEIVEIDPSLCAQLIRYAQSPMYGFLGKIKSIREVISIILGYDLVLDIALGVSLGQTLRVPANGPLGLNAFWKHSVYCASLAQQLAGVVNTSAASKPEPGLAYLAGLLHNFGFLLTGHLFPDAYRQMNHRYQDNPHMPVRTLEKEILGEDHTHIGAWLMESWNLPGEIVAAARNHHDETSQGEYAVYAKLVLIANRLLKSYDIGDAETEEIPDELLEELGLTYEKLEIVLHTLTEQGRETLNSMALQLAA